MVLVLEEKFLERTWWKYGLAVFGVQMLCWLLLGYKINPQIDLLFVLRTGAMVYGTFFVAAFLPFAVGRLQLRRLFWFGLVGFAIADIGYFMLALFEPVRRLNLLPFISFVQIYVTFFGLGVILELGRYVYHKLTE